MTHTTLELAAFLIAGAALGVVWLGLLWMSARAIASPRPVARFALLAAARAALLWGALALAFGSGATAVQVLAGLAGLILVRIAATRVLRTPTEAAPWK